MKELWNARYAVKEYVYGRLPNVFFSQWIDNEIPGSVLLPSEGEGRNAVYAASKGWDVYALDYSIAAKSKALALAEENNVQLNYDVADMAEWDKEVKVDLIGLIYAHWPSEVREQAHSKLIGKLNRGGAMLLEAFSKNQLNFNSGGPKSSDMLYDVGMLRKDFRSLNITHLQEKNVILDEGGYHQGKASIIRMIARKK